MPTLPGETSVVAFRALGWDLNWPRPLLPAPVEPLRNNELGVLGQTGGNG